MKKVKEAKKLNIITKKNNSNAKFKNSTSGITLIVLVITIIVLLILVGVTIATLTGDNGILSKANEAKEETERKTIEEKRKLAMLEAKSNLKQTEFQNIKIPAGYAPTRIEGESTIDEGLVIIDAYGNEYVWIEVPKSTEVYTTDVLEYNLNNIDNKDELISAYKKIEICLHNYTSVYRNNTTNVDEWHLDSANNNKVFNMSEDEYNELKYKMLKSIFENKGFFVGRYEAGDEYSTNNNILRTSTSGITNKLVTKINQIPYNYISMNNAQKLARDVQNTDNEYTSSLMFGVQWDLMLKFFEVRKGATINKLNSSSVGIGIYSGSNLTINRGKYSINGNSEWNDYTVNSPGYIENSIKISDRNKYMLFTTGASDKTKICNVYDVAGNLWEMTLEYNYTGFYGSTHRGGCSLNRWNGSSGPASQRYFKGYGTSIEDGFRIAIY